MQAILIKNGSVLPFTGRGPDLAATRAADVLIEDGKITAIEAGLEHAGALVLDATGCLVMPGLIDTHRHVWQTAARGVCHDDTLKGYMRQMRFLRSQVYRPEDIRIGNLAGMLEAINAGITTVFDFSHCVNTPEHAAAAIDGLRASGARAVFGYGFNDVPLPERHFRDFAARAHEMRRIRERELADDGALVTMAAATSDLPICGLDQLAQEIAAARALDLRISIHINTWEYPERPPEVAQLHERRLLGKDLLFVHANLSADDELRMIADAGAWIVTTPETEMQMSMGPSVLGRFLHCGGKPTFGCDIISNNSGDLLVQARLGLQVQRMLDNAAILATHRAADEVSLTSADVLRALTVDAAAALGLEGRIGMLAPGMAADVILVRTDAINTMPVHDPLATLLLHAHPGNVDTVIVAGRVLKRDGRLCADLDLVRAALLRSHEYVNDAIARIEVAFPAGYQAD